jgi:hypothetical protein
VWGRPRPSAPQRAARPRQPMQPQPCALRSSRSAAPTAPAHPTTPETRTTTAKIGRTLYAPMRPHALAHAHRRIAEITLDARVRRHACKRKRGGAGAKHLGTSAARIGEFRRHIRKCVRCACECVCVCVCVCV